MYILRSFRRFSSVRASKDSLCKMTAEVIGGKRLAEDVEAASLSTLNSKFETYTDSWLKNALVYSNKLNKDKRKDVLSLNIIIKTLQKLRSVEDYRSYFILLNKINSVDIQWVSHSGKPLKLPNSTPVEFYHELSKMLSKLSKQPSSYYDTVILAKFTLKLLDEYNTDFAIKDQVLRTKSSLFFQNCLTVIIKSESVFYLQATLKKIFQNPKGISKPCQETLQHYAILSFYFQTSQTPKMLQYLNENILSESLELAENSNILVPLLLEITHKCISLELEEVTCLILHTLRDKFHYTLSSCDFVKIRDLSEKFALFKVHLTLYQLHPNDETLKIAWKTFQKDLDFKGYVDLFEESNLDFFKELLDVDFLQDKLPKKYTKLDEWKTFIKDTEPSKEAPDSLNAFYIDCVLRSSASNRYLGFVSLLWYHLVVELDKTKDFINTSRIMSRENNSDFHILLHSVGRSSASKLSGSVLFNFLRKDYQKCNNANTFKFTVRDYYSLMRSCLYGNDHHLVYYYLFHYLLDMGHELLTKDLQGVHQWSLPNAMESMLSRVVVHSLGDSQMDSLLKNVRSWYIQSYIKKGESCQIDFDTLRSMFGHLFIEKLDLENLIELEKKYGKNNNEYLSLGKYWMLTDLENAKRLKKILNCIKERLEIK